MTPGLIRAVAAAVGITSGSARRIAASATHRYKVYRIPKRSGGSRTVAQPAREVKALQRVIVQELQKYLPVHGCATAYVTGRSIKDNALPHLDARYLLKLDLCEFFPSITYDALNAHLRAHLPSEYSEAELKFILDLVLWIDERGRRGLCIGAPSSPLLSNSVMFEFDTRVSTMCESLGVQYTRYSDDLSFSSRLPDVLREAEDRVSRILAELPYPTVALNDPKRRAVSRAAGMYVTGLTLSNQGSVTVGRARKRGVRAGVKRYVNGMLDGPDVEKLRGELAFVLSVEPGFRQVLVRTYGARASELMSPERIKGEQQ